MPKQKQQAPPGPRGRYIILDPELARLVEQNRLPNETRSNTLRRVLGLEPYAYPRGGRPPGRGKRSA